MKNDEKNFTGEEKNDRSSDRKDMSEFLLEIIIYLWKVIPFIMFFLAALCAIKCLCVIINEVKNSEESSVVETYDNAEQIDNSVEAFLIGYYTHYSISN